MLKNGTLTFGFFVLNLELLTQPLVWTYDLRFRRVGSRAIPKKPKLLQPPAGKILIHQNLAQREFKSGACGANSPTPPQTGKKPPPLLKSDLADKGGGFLPVLALISAFVARTSSQVVRFPFRISLCGKKYADFLNVRSSYLE